MKFIVEVQDKAWEKEILKNEALKSGLERGDVDPKIFDDDEELAKELFGFITVGFEQFDIRDHMTVRKVEG